jgi:signal transduction histidine kinase
MVGRLPTLRSASPPAGYLRSQFFWNPLISLGFTLVYAPWRHFPLAFAVSWMISIIVSNVCIAAVHVGDLVLALLARRAGAPPPPKRAVVHFLVSVAALPAGLYLGFHAAHALLHRLGHEMNLPSLVDYRDYILIGSLIGAVFFLAHGRSEARVAAERAALRVRELENERLKAALAAVSARLNPHLLFNTLNTIASLIPSDPERAEHTLLQLSELYRGVLRASDRATHGLADELALVRAYLEIEQARFGARLQVVLDVPDVIDLELPVLLLQPLVENAVRHGLAGRAAGGTVWVRLEAADAFVTLVVEDDGVGLGRSAARGGAGTALADCRRRLELIYGGEARLELSERAGGGTCARVTLPRPLPLTRAVGA